MNKVLLYTFLVAVMSTACNRKIGAVFSKKEKLQVINPDFSYLEAKSKFKFDNKGKKISATANFRMQKDQIIWISVSGFGLEAARVLIDTNHVQVLDRLNKKYYDYTFAELSEKYDFDFNFKLIQSVLLGNLIAPYHNEKVEKTDTHFFYTSINGDYFFDNYIGSRTMKLEKVAVLDTASDNTITVDYGQFTVIDDQIFPSEIAAVINYSKAGKDNTTFNISYNRMSITDESIKFPFSVSSKYERK